jgi:hypothetical protein
MFKAKTIEDFKELRRLVEELNKEGVWKLEIKIGTEYSECDLYVVDHTEELYYGGCLFEKTIEKLDAALKEDTNDKSAYFDCVCPGRWLADFEGRSRYDEESMKLDISIAIKEAMCKYMDDNGLKPYWTVKTQQKLDEVPNIAVELIKEVLK